MRGKPDWEESDLVSVGSARRIPAVVGIVGLLRWAKRGSDAQLGPGASSFARFARTSPRRYRWVNQWLIWNEPNQRRWLRPTDAGTYVRQLLNPGYRAIHAVNPARRLQAG